MPRRELRPTAKGRIPLLERKIDYNDYSNGPNGPAERGSFGNQVGHPLKLGSSTQPLEWNDRP